VLLGRTGLLLGRHKAIKHIANRLNSRSILHAVAADRFCIVALGCRNMPNEDWRIGLLCMERLGVDARQLKVFWKHQPIL
jgi:hypothetical protein